MDRRTQKDEILKVIEENKGIIYKVANAYCQHEEDRKDLVQEIVIQVWKSFGRYNKQSQLSTWIYRIALNVSISFYRKNATRKKSITPLTEHSSSFIDERHSDNTAQIGLLHQFIHALKELDKALMLLYLEEKSHNEMAEILGISPSNVATKINRIKLKLKQEFQKHQ